MARRLIVCEQSDQLDGTAMNASADSFVPNTIPWYRQNWFAILCGLFFSPALLPPLLTGDIYYRRNGELRRYSKGAKIFLIIWATLGAVYLVATFGSGFVKGFRASLAGRVHDANVEMVRGGTLSACPSATVGKMVDSFLDDPSWESGVGEGNVRFVNIAGGMTYADKLVRAVIQFTVDDKNGTFEYNAFEINEVPQNKLMALGLITKMCESANGHS